MTKFLVDECVDQKPIRAIPTSSKGFEIAFPRDLSFSGAGDVSVAKLAQVEARVLVTSDSDFFRLHLKPGDVSQGVLWLHAKRSSKQAIGSLLKKFCRYRQERFSHDPYNFSGQMIEVREDGIQISSLVGTEFHPWPADHSTASSIPGTLTP
jgi:predicted nuclease of predicted toxin-antitoxin system